jgi:hypothetical protein
MSLFSEFERTIERGFRRWTEHVFGPADSDQLLLVHRAILEEVETKVETLARGRRVFPFPHLTVTLFSPDAARRTVYQAAFSEEGRLESDVREALEGAGCELPRGFSVEVRTAEDGPGPFQIEYSAVPAEVPAAHVEEAAPAAEAGRLTVIRGKAASSEYPLEKARVNIGRMAELTDADHRVVRRNDIVFEDGADDANATVSRSHAHIRRDGADYRICDDESEYGTRIFRDGRPIDVPAGNRRGERLRPGDEIYLGRACLRFDQ